MVDRVALQLLGPSTGGIRQHVAQLAHGLPEGGWQARVAGPAGVGEGADLRHASVVPVPSGPNPLGVLRARAALRPLSLGTDLVHAHGLKAGWVAALAGTGLPLVVTVHNLVLDEAAGHSAGALRRLEGWLPAHADGVIAVSQAIAERFGGPSESLWVVPPAGPPPRPGRDAATVRTALGVALDAPMVVSVARLHPQKDLLTLIDAAAILRLEVPGVRVVIVGEGPLEPELRRRVDEQGLAGTVLLAGPSANAADEMAAADVVVVTSLWESGPLVAAEALLLERPLVSTPVGFVPRLVDHGVSGWSTPVGDAGAVAHSLAQALGDPTAAAAMARIGRERVEALLGAQRLVGEVAAVYDRVLARHEASR